MRIARVLVALAVVLVTVGGIGGNDDFDGKLRSQEFVGPLVRKLPGGGQVAFGSPDGHRLQVQWRGPAAGGWTDPVTIEKDNERWVHWLKPTIAGRTVAVDVSWYDNKELYYGSGVMPQAQVTSQVICFDRVCLRANRPFDGGSGYTTLARDGQFASFAGGDDLLLWSPEGDFRTRRITGMPDGDDDFQWVLLGPGDVFVGVVGVMTKGGCRYDLYVSPAQDPTLAGPVVSSPDVKPRRCNYVHVTAQKNGILLEPERLPSIRFRPDGQTWVVESQ